MTKQEQKDAVEAAYEVSLKQDWAAYRARQESAYEACRAELERIDNEPDENIIEVDGKKYQLIK